MKLCFCDVETTGIDRKLCEVIQISMIFENTETGKSTEREWKCRPRNADDLAIYEQGALDKTGLTIEKIKTFPNPDETYVKVFSTLGHCVDKYNSNDKMFFLAYNADFDYSFLRSWSEAAGEKYFGSFFHFPFIDVMQTAALVTMGIRHKVKNFTLKNICELFDIEFDEEKAHEASYDNRKTMELYHKLTEG